jgi:hypothetical protein
MKQVLLGKLAKKFPTFYGTWSSLSCSQEPAISPYTELYASSSHFPPSIWILKFFCIFLRLLMNVRRMNTILPGVSAEKFTCSTGLVNFHFSHMVVVNWFQPEIYMISACCWIAFLKSGEMKHSHEWPGSINRITVM